MHWSTPEVASVCTGLTTKEEEKPPDCHDCSPNLPAKEQHLDSYFESAVSAFMSCIFHFKYPHASVSPMFHNTCSLLLAFQHFINCRLFFPVLTDSELGKEKQFNQGRKTI